MKELFAFDTVACQSRVTAVDVGATILESYTNVSHFDLQIQHEKTGSFFRLYTMEFLAYYTGNLLLPVKNNAIRLIQKENTIDFFIWNYHYFLEINPSLDYYRLPEPLVTSDVVVEHAREIKNHRLARIIRVKKAGETIISMAVGYNEISKMKYTVVRSYTINITTWITERCILLARRGSGEAFWAISNGLQQIGIKVVRSKMDYSLPVRKTFSHVCEGSGWWN